MFSKEELCEKQRSYIRSLKSVLDIQDSNKLKNLVVRKLSQIGWNLMYSSLSNR